MPSDEFGVREELRVPAVRCVASPMMIQRFQDEECDAHYP